ncbi:hypothetical protein [Nonomuraea typhae]|uniref:Secreted protein n=1 Tax=Nonomuraea typhae TaxID=2603600 RepID=A0ABW7Z9G7_9ACTN
MSLSLAGPAGATSLAGDTTKASACNVQHGPWYTVGMSLRVDLYNECSTGKYVCISRPYPMRHPGPKHIAGYQTLTWSYGTSGGPAGTSLYYAKNSTNCT